MNISLIKTIAYTFTFLAVIWPTTPVCGFEFYKNRKSQTATEDQPAKAVEIPDNQTPTEDPHGNVDAIIVAKVNSNGIALRDLMNKIREITMKNYGREQITPSLAERIKNEALNRLIIEELAFQRARAMGVQIRPEDIAQKTAQMKKWLGGEEQFQDYLIKNNMTEQDFRIQTERYLAVKKALEQEVIADIEVTEEDIQNAYAEAKEEYFVQQEKITVDQVIFFLDSKSKESIKKAEEIRAKAINEYAGNLQKLPADTSMLVLTNVALNEDTDKALYAAAKQMQINDLSEVINDNGTLYLIKLLAYTPRVEKPLDEVRPYLRRKLKERFRQKAIEEWRASLKEGANIEIIDTALESTP